MRYSLIKKLEQIKKSLQEKNDLLILVEKRIFTLEKIEKDHKKISGELFDEKKQSDRLLLVC